MSTASLKLSGGFDQRGGTFNLQGSTMGVAAGWSNTGGTFTAGTSTVTFDSTASNTITPNGQSFSHVVFTRTALGFDPTFTLGGDLSATGNLTISVGTLDTSSSNYSITVSSDVDITGGIFNLNASTMGVSGNWSETAGSFNAGSSTVTFNATSAKTITSSDQSFSHVVFNGSNGTWTLGDQLTAGGNFTVTAGTLTTSGSNYGISVSSDVKINGGTLTLNASTMTVTSAWTFSSGTFNANTSTVTFTAATTKTITSGGQSFSHIVFNPGGGVIQIPSHRLADALSATGNLTVTSGALDTSSSNYSVTVSSNVNINGGIFTLNASTMSVAGNWTRSSGTFNANTSTVTFNAASAKTLTSGGSSFSHLVFNGSGGQWRLGGALAATGILTVTAGTFTTSASNYSVTVSSNVNINGGTFNLNASTMGVAGNWTNTGGTFTAGTSTVTFNSGGARTITPNGQNFSHIVFTNDGVALNPTYYTLGGALSAVGNLTISAGTLDTSSSNYSITVSSDVNINGGTFTLNASTMTAGGNWTLTSGTFNANTSTVTFNASSAKTLTSGGSSFAHVTINAASGSPTFTLGDQLTAGGNFTVTAGSVTTSSSNYGVSVTSNVTVGSGTTFNLNASTMTVAASWSNSGTFSATSGSTVTFTGNTPSLTGSTTFYNLQYSVGGGTMTFATASTQTVSGLLTSTGTSSSNLITLRSSSSGSPWFLRNSGTNNVSYVDVRDSDARAGNVINNTTGGVDSGNNKNWNFSTAGQTRTWWGNQNTDWSSTYNWDVGVVPGSSDTALIVSTATNMPTLTADVPISTLTINSGAALTLNGFNITLSSFTNAGNFIFLGTEQVSTAPNGISGSTITYNNTSGTTLILSTWTYRNLAINGAVGTFNPQAALSINESLSVSAGTLDTISGTNWSMRASSNVFINGGTFNLNASTMNVGGSWSNTSGTFTAGTSTVTFNGSGANTITPRGQNFSHMTVNGSATWTLGGALSATGNITVTAGTFTTSASNYSVTVSSNVNINGGTFTLNASTMSAAGNWTFSSGTFNASTSTVTFNASSAKTLTSGGSSFSHLVFNGSGGAWTLGDQLTATGNLTATNGTLTTSGSNYGISVSSDVRINGGTLNLNASTMSVSNNWTYTSGNFNSGTSTVTFNGASAFTVTPGTQTFANLTINNPARTGTWNLGSALSATGNLTVTAGTLNTSSSNYSITVSSNVNINGGTFTLNGSTMSVAGNWTLSPGAVFSAVSPSTVTFNGSGTYTITTGGFHFYRIQFNQSVGVWNLGDVLVADAPMTITAGAVDLKGNDLTVTNALSNSGDLRFKGTEQVTPIPTLVSGSTVTYNNTSGTTLILSTWTYSNLVINGSGGVFNLQKYLPVNQSLTLSAGSALDLKGSSVTVTNAINNSGDFRFKGTEPVSPVPTNVAGSTITYNNTSGTTLILSTWTYQNLIINGSSGAIFQLQASTTAINQLFTVSGGTFSTSGSNFNVTLSTVVINSGGIFNMNSSTAIFISGSWTNNGGTTVVGASTVTFTGNTPSLTGSTTFYNLQYSVGGGTMTFAIASTQTVQGLLTMNGGSGSLVTLRSSSSGGSPWFLRNSGTNNVSYVDVKDSDARAGNVINNTTGGVNSGNNLNWNFGIGQTRTWTGGTITDTDWSNCNNWDTACPTPLDNAVIAATSNQPTLKQAAVTVSTLTINFGASLTLNGFNLTLSSFTNAGSFIFKGTEIVSTAPNGISGSTVTYNNTSGTTLILSTWTYRNLVINGSGGTFSPSSAAGLTMIDGLFLTAGTLDTTTNNYSLTVSTGNVTINGGTLKLNASTMTVGGNWTKTGGTFTAGTSTVTFTSAGSQTITSGDAAFYHLQFTGAGGAYTLQDRITVNGNLALTVGSGSLDTGASYALTVAGDVILNSVTLNLHDSTVTVSGSWTSVVPSQVNVIPGGSKIVFNATSAKTFTTGSSFFNDLQFNGAGGTWVLQDDLIFAGTLFVTNGTFDTQLGGGHLLTVSGVTINGGTFNARNSPINVTGNWTLTSGSFVGDSGARVDFKGTANSTSTITGSTTFSNLQCFTANKWLRFQAGSTTKVKGDFKMQGISGSPIKLRSTTQGQPWFLNYSGASRANDVIFADVQDSNAAAGNTIFAGPSSSGSRTVNWNFGVSASTIVVKGVLTNSDGVIVGVSGAAQPTLIFDGAIDPVTLTNPSVSIQAIKDNLDNVITPSQAVSFLSSFDGTSFKATLTPSLTKGYTYQITVTTNVRDLGGNPIPVAIGPVTFRVVMDKTVSNRMKLAAYDSKSTLIGSAVVNFPAGSLPQDGFFSFSGNPQVSPIQASLSLIQSANDRARSDSAYALPITMMEGLYYDTQGALVAQNFSSPVTITFPLPAGSGGLVGGTGVPVKMSALNVRWLDPSLKSWIKLSGAAVDSTARTVTASVYHFSVYGVFGAPDTATADAYAFPVPFKPSLGHTNITFINLPSEADIKIFTINGELVKKIQHSDASGTSGKEVWDVTNSNGEPLASEVYYYVIVSQGQTKNGKIMVVR